MQESSTMEMTQLMNSNHSTLVEQLQQLKQQGENSLKQQDQKFKTLVNELSDRIQNNKESFTLLNGKENDHNNQ